MAGRPTRLEALDGRSRKTGSGRQPGKSESGAMFSKILVANRGEIAIRAFRAAYELGIASVAVFPYEDRNSVHRQKADEAYQIGERGHPVRAYLDVDEIVRAALASGADAVYPGYGFLSENPGLAQACADAGITFIGPSASVLEMAGNKATAVAAARAAGVPVLESSEPSADVDVITASAEAIGYPVFVKAVAGGGGRGMRRVDTPDALPEALATAMREAESAFGDATVFLERAVIEPRHIEVQILADHRAADGVQAGTIHLYERDCSVQRRHQKVIEVAPAVGLDPELRARICADAVAFARHIGYVNAGTVEFLLDEQGRHVFIEMNPRIQVEHTVTEEITDVDLVASQIRIAAGETLDDLGLRQDEIQIRGAALQCRITTEDPANGFRPDTGKIITYRSPGGGGTRVDGGTVHSGAEVSAHFDSLLVKLTCRGRDWPQAVARARRALAEFRIRGVATNIPFLQAVLEDPDFAAGGVTTSFIETHPQLLTARHSADRGTRLLTYLADVTINRPHGTRPATLIDPAGKLPVVDLGQAGAERHPAATAGAGSGRVRRVVAHQHRPQGHRHHLPGRPSVAARHQGPDPRSGADRPGGRPAHPGTAVHRGVGRGHLRRRAAVPGRGPLGTARHPARGDPEHRAADAAPRPEHRRLHALSAGGHRRLRQGGGEHRHRHLPDLRRAQRRRADAAGHRRGPGDRDRDRRGRPLLHRRPVRSRPRSSTPWTTTCGWPSGSSRPAPTCWRSRTWPDCSAPRPPGRWSPRCASGSTCRCTCTPTTRPAVSSRPTWWRPRPGSTRWTRPVRRWPAPPRSRRCPHWSRPPTSPTGRPVCGSRRSRTWSRTGRRCARCTRRSSPGCGRRPAGSTGTRSPAGSCPTCGNRPSRSGSAASSSRSSRPTRRRTPCWATW